MLLRPAAFALLCLVLLPFAAAGDAATAASAAAATESASSTASKGLFVSRDGVVSPADVSWSGDCNGQGFLTVTIHEPAGAQTWTLPYQSTMALDVCDAVTRCYECPPIPLAFAWTLDDWEGGSHLAGGGTAYYDTYRTWTLAWSMQGSFLDGWLEFRGVLKR